MSIKQDHLVSGHRLVIGAVEVPIGRYTRTFLTGAEAHYGADFTEAVLDGVVSQEHSVRLARARVVLGEADAAVVYRTDTHTDDVVVVPIPAALNMSVAYHLGVIDRASPAASQWAAWVLAPAGQAVLAAHGFGVSE